MQLLSTSTRVEAPIIGVTIGGITMGLYKRAPGQVELFGKYYAASSIIYPNYIKSLNVVKINGTLNTYTLALQYAITPQDDPNLLDKILSKASKSREITFTYGDATSPNFMYREEKAIITAVKSSPDIANARIDYTITAVSNALKASTGTFNFPRRENVKPSDVILEILYNQKTGLLDIFYGMQDKGTVTRSNLIARDDKPVTIEAQTNITYLDYLRYLVGCMASINDRQDSLYKTIRYVLVFHDEVSENISGPFFTVSKVVTSAPQDTSVDIYEMDIGFPGKDLVSQFSINDDQTYAILYDYASSIELSDITYSIDDAGNPITSYSPTIAKNSSLLKTTAAEKTWWSQMTQFPIKATVTIKGLLRASVLMSYIRINVYFYGKKHNSSGLYIITRQEDNINERGYTTTLSLLRIQGDDLI